MKEITLTFDLAQAYLEMARAHLKVPVVSASKVNTEDVRMTNNTYIALIAHGYIFSYMALTAFVSGTLWKAWEQPASSLRVKYPNAESFEHLLNSNLRRLKDSITELCLHLNLQPLAEADPPLWIELLQVLKKTRDFMVHPTPNPSEFHKVVSEAMERHSWGKPIEITERVMRYFFSRQPENVPSWLSKNEDFCFEAIRALRVAPRF